MQKLDTLPAEAAARIVPLDGGSDDVPRRDPIGELCPRYSYGRAEVEVVLSGGN